MTALAVLLFMLLVYWAGFVMGNLWADLRRVERDLDEMRGSRLETRRLEDAEKGDSAS